MENVDTGDIEMLDAPDLGERDMARSRPPAPERAPKRNYQEVDADENSDAQRSVRQRRVPVEAEPEAPIGPVPTGTDMVRLRTIAFGRAVKRNYDDVDESAYDEEEGEEGEEATQQSARRVRARVEQETDPLAAIDRRRKRRRSRDASPEEVRPEKRSRDESASGPMDQFAPLPPTRTPLARHLASRFASKRDCYAFVAGLLKVDARRYLDTSGASSSPDAQDAQSAEGDEVSDLLRRLSQISVGNKRATTMTAVDALIAIGKSINIMTLITFGAQEGRPFYADRLVSFMRSKAAVDVLGVDAYLGGPKRYRSTPAEFATIQCMGNEMLRSLLRELLRDDPGIEEHIGDAFRASLSVAEAFFMDMNALNRQDREFVVSALVADDKEVHITLAAALIQTVRGGTAGGQVRFAGMPWLSAWRLSRALRDALGGENGDSSAHGVAGFIAHCETLRPGAYDWVARRGQDLVFPFLSASAELTWTEKAIEAARSTTSPETASALLREIGVGVRAALASFGRERLALIFLVGCFLNADRSVPAINPAYMWLPVVDAEFLPEVAISLHARVDSPLISALRALTGRVNSLFETPEALNLYLLAADVPAVSEYLSDRRHFNERAFSRDPFFFVERILRAPPLAGAKVADLRRRTLRALFARDLLMDPVADRYDNGNDVDRLLFASSSVSDVIVALRAVYCAPKALFSFSDAARTHLDRLIYTADDEDRAELPALYCALLALLRVTDNEELISSYIQEHMFAAIPWLSRSRASYGTVLHLMRQGPVAEITLHAESRSAPAGRNGCISPLALFADRHGRRSLSFMTALRLTLALSTTHMTPVYDAYVTYTSDLPLVPLDLARMRTRMGVAVDVDEFVPRCASAIEAQHVQCLDLIGYLAASQTFQHLSVMDGSLIGAVVGNYIKRTASFPNGLSRTNALVTILAGCSGINRANLWLFGPVFRALNIAALEETERHKVVRLAINFLRNTCDAIIKRAGANGAVQLARYVGILYGSVCDARLRDGRRPGALFFSDAAAIQDVETLLPQLHTINDDNIVGVLLALDSTAGTDNAMLREDFGLGRRNTDACHVLFGIYRKLANERYMYRA
jgi:hypothetical protein